jgi:hypothetical protein
MCRNVLPLKFFEENYIMSAVGLPTRAGKKLQPSIFAIVHTYIIPSPPVAYVVNKPYKTKALLLEGP